MIQGFSSGLIGNRELIYETDLPSFQRDFASVKTLDHGTGPAITFTRASGATYFDVNGVLQTAADDVARFDHDPATGASRGLLIEESRTNSIRNSQGGGSTNGVIGSGGVVPTNWSAPVPTGVSIEVIGTGTVNGLSYLDIKYSGTRSGGAVTSITLFPESTTTTVAATGQTWTGSAYIAVVAGGFTNITSPGLTLSERSVAGVQLITSTTSLSSATATLARYDVARTFTNATTERTSISLVGSVADGAAIDITLRIAAPQLELGAFPTSYIPTTTAAATRSADSAVVTPISSFYNPVESTILSELSSASVAFDSTILAINNTSQNEQLDQRLSITSITSRTRVGGVNQASIAGVNPVVAPVSGTTYRFASTHKLDDFAASQDGNTAQTDTAGSMPSGLSRMEIGSRAGSGLLTGHIRKIAYWPKRLSNTLLEQLTT